MGRRPKAFRPRGEEGDTEQSAEGIAKVVHGRGAQGGRPLTIPAREHAVRSGLWSMAGFHTDSQGGLKDERE